MMPLKITSMKFINKAVTAFILLSFVFSAEAQEIIAEDVPVKKDTVGPFKRKKIDCIIATVGEYIILDSDIDMEYIELSSQGISINNVSRCELLGKLMEDKLYAHQAIQDSLKVTDSEVKSLMEERLSYMVEQIGSMEKVVKYYKKNSEEEFRRRRRNKHVAINSSNNETEIKKMDKTNSKTKRAQNNY